MSTRIPDAPLRAPSLAPLLAPLLPLLLAAALPAQAGQSTYGLARARELAALGQLPRASDVVVRDIVNYHRHRLPLPRAGREVELDVRFGGARTGARGRAVLQIGMTTAPARGSRAAKTTVATRA